MLQSQNWPKIKNYFGNMHIYSKSYTYFNKYQLIYINIKDKCNYIKITLNIIITVANNTCNLIYLLYYFLCYSWIFNL